jgi:hypothetical protein
MFKLPRPHFLKLMRTHRADAASAGAPHPHAERGQSYVELALVLPILLLMLLGLVEVSIFIGRYLDVLDLTREAARWASVKDPSPAPPNPQLCNGELVFFYQTACIFSPPANACEVGNPFCGGNNPYVTLDLTSDDVVISVFTVDSNNVVSNVWPNRDMRDPTTNLVHANQTMLPNYYQGTAYVDENGATQYYWALSDNLPAWAGHPTFPSRDYSAPAPSNWKKDCKGNVVRQMPYYTPRRVQSITTSTSFVNPQGTATGAPGNKGFVAVELYYCYKQALNIPLYTFFIPNPVMIHAYTLMPLPNAAPTATPAP